MTDFDSLAFPAPRPITLVGRERAEELMAEARKRGLGEDFPAEMMLRMFDEGLVEAGEDAIGGLHWRVTAKGAAATGADIDAMFGDRADE